MSSAPTRTLTVPRRFRGPERSGNGGWTAGSLAALVPTRHPRPVVEVTLRRPPPLETPLPVEDLESGDDGTGRASEGPVTALGPPDARVAEAREVVRDLAVVPPVAEDEAAAAMTGYRGRRGHPFPGCFACGTERAEGDGLRIFPGPVGPDTVASRWVPDASLAEHADGPGEPWRVGRPVAWAALDCVGGWSEDLEGRPMVLGRMTARVDRLPAVGEPHVVVGRRLRVEGRKTFTASTLYDSTGRLLATAEHVWLAVDPSTFG